MCPHSLAAVAHCCCRVLSRLLLFPGLLLLQMLGSRSSCSCCGAGLPCACVLPTVQLMCRPVPPRPLPLRSPSLCLQSSLMGASLTLPVQHGRLALGTWQGIYLNEHRWAGGRAGGQASWQGMLHACRQRMRYPAAGG